MKQITVIIPNYNGKQHLMSCLWSLTENIKIPYDVIVVDNHSQDDSVKEAMKTFPQVEYVLLDNNYGFSRAVNEGIKRAVTPYVILLNNDTVIQKGFAEALLRRIKSNPRFFSVEAKMLNYHNPKKIDSAGTFYNILGWARARGKDRDAKHYQKACITFAACAGAAIYRKSVFDEIGLFDEKYFAYLEDIDIGYRARLKGYQNAYEPKARVLHVGSASTGSRYNDFKVRISARNNIYLIHKNMPWIQKLLRFPFFVAGFLIKFMYFITKGYGKQYVSGFKDGLKMCNGQRMKRMMDIMGAFAALLIFSPVMLLASIAVKMTSKGPVIFKQERVGLQDENFQMYKFRSMIVQDEDAEKEMWTVKDDPRITSVGRFLRKTNIDELPQLFNVLKGDMSLVGPRPERPQFVEKFEKEIPEYRRRHQMKPGLTGWAQIHGYRGDTSIRKRVEYDLHYVENWGILLDMTILSITLFKGLLNDEN